MMCINTKIGRNALIGGLIVLYAIIVIRTAWLSDDAYITLRTVDNFINGHGLRWNIAERVQAYTHPLWMFLLSGVYVFTHEAYFSTLFLSMTMSIAAVAVMAFGLARSTLGALLGILILTLSKAFTDYSTSGLENPLTHLIVAVFLLLYFRLALSHKKLFWLSLIASLGVLNRMDTLLFYLPVLIYTFFQLRDVKAIVMGVVGFVPFILWELFSLFYYGFPFPNTAYAKLNTGISRMELAERGVAYLSDSFNVDPLTLTVIVGVLLWLLLTKAWPEGVVAVGILLYLLYIIRIGGDFMSGRFLAAPLFIAVTLLVSRLTTLPRPAWLLIFAGIIGLGVSTPYSPLFSDSTYGENGEAYQLEFGENNGVVDERAFYYPKAGLLKVWTTPELLQKDILDTTIPVVTISEAIGQLGFGAEPDTHIIDTYALADPFLARLPILRDTHWRIGHLWRRIPDGYEQTVRTGQNQIENENLARYYDKLSTVIAGHLFDLNRLVEIWRLNTGAYAHLLDAYPRPNSLRIPLTDFNRQTIDTLIAKHNLEDYSNFQIDLPHPSHARQIAVQLLPSPHHQIAHDRESYQLLYYSGDAVVDYQIAWLFFLQTIPESGVTSMLTVPEKAVEHGYDRIKIFPANDDTIRNSFIHNIAAVQLVEEAPIEDAAVKDASLENAP